MSYTETYLPATHRALPASVEAEQGVLGCMLIGGSEVIEEVLSKLTALHFHIPAHVTVFGLLEAMHRAKIPCDFITLTQQMKDQGLLEEVGGPFFITNLFTFVPTTANANYYIEIVREKYILRRIIETCTRAVTRAYDDQDDVKGLLDEVQGEIVEIGQETSTVESLRQIGPDVDAALASIENTYEHRGGVTGLSTGFVDLDRSTGGLQPGYTYYFAGRPAMGKSSFGMNIAEHIAVTNIEDGHAVGVFSVEMTRQQLVLRMLCGRAGVNLKRIRDGFLKDADFPNMTRVAAELIRSKFFVDDKGDLSIFEFRARARRAVVKHGCRLLVIDYIQRMKSTSKRAQGNREQEINEIAQGISATAKELQVPIIVLAQLNRGPEERKNGVPQLADLRESGSMEQEAHLVGLLYRPEYYAKNDEQREALSGQAELIIAKQRDGPIGPIKLRFVNELARFENALNDDGTERPLYTNNKERRQNHG